MKFLEFRGIFVKYLQLPNGIVKQFGCNVAAITVIALAVQSTAAAGTITAAESDAYGVGASINVLGGALSLSVANVPPTSGTYPANYNNTNTLASLNVSTTGLASVSTGVIDVGASSNITGSSGSVTGTSSVDGLSVVVNGVITPLVSIASNGDTLVETSTVTAAGGVLTGSSTLTVEGSSNVVISVLGTVYATLNSGSVIGPNDTIAIAGIGSLVLNQQVFDTGSNGSTFEGLQSNFLALDVDPALGLNTVAVDVIIDHSHASMNAASVPEPSSLILAGVGILTCLGTKFVRRRFC